MNPKLGVAIIAGALLIVCAGVGYVIYDGEKKEQFCHEKGGMYFAREQKCVKGKEIPLQ